MYRKSVWWVIQRTSSVKFINIEHYNACGNNEHDEALLKLEHEIKEYNTYFNSIKDRFSKIFCREYLNCHGFHDWTLTSIEYSKHYRRKKSCLIVTLYNQWDDVTKKIIYSGVRIYNANFSKEHFGTWDTYFLDEFIKLDDLYLSHEVLFPSKSSYYVEFKKIKIE